MAKRGARSLPLALGVIVYVTFGAKLNLPRMSDGHPPEWSCQHQSNRLIEGSENAWLEIELSFEVVVCGPGIAMPTHWITWVGDQYLLQRGNGVALGVGWASFR